MLKKLLRATAIAGAALAVAASGLLHTAGAQAAGAVCGVDTFCLYYSTNQQGSMAGFTASASSYWTPTGSYKFVTSGAGQGKAVDNNAASAWNRTGRDITVYADPSMKGSHQTIPAGAKMNLNSSLSKKTSSHSIPPKPNRTTKPTGKLTAPCPVGTTDLGLTKDAYIDGKKTTVRLCAINNIKSSGGESNPKSAYYVDGAAGKCVVNASVAGALYNLAEAATKAGRTVSANSCYRTMAHQQVLWDAEVKEFNGDKAKARQYVAEPGQSNHQGGNAIDFTMTGTGDRKSCNLVNGVCTPPASANANTKKLYEWLTKNAAKYGFKQYNKEAWHWSPNGK